MRTMDCDARSTTPNHDLKPWIAGAVTLLVIIAGAACGGPPAGPGDAPPVAGQDVDEADAPSPTPVVERSPGQVLPMMPAAPDRSADYLVYLHGAIIETGGRRPTHPTNGVYELDQLLDAFAERGFTVLAPIREAGADIATSADRTVADIRSLLQAGVPAAHIAVVGFSKGGMIAVETSQRLGRDDVTFVWLATCYPRMRGDRSRPPRGRILSVLETSDQLTASCRPAMRWVPTPGLADELQVELGGGHGAFYRPQDAWLDPVVDWIRADDGA